MGISSHRKTRPRTLWRRDLHQLPNDRSLIEPSGLIVPERKSWLARIDPLTGGTIWQARVLNTRGWLTRSTERVYWLNQHELLACLDVSTGAECWKVSVGAVARGSIFGHLVMSGPVVVTGGWRGYTPLVGLDATNGEVRWVRDVSSPVATPVAGPWGLALPFTDEDLLVLLDPADGREELRLRLPGRVAQPDHRPALSSDGERLYCATEDGSCFVLVPDSPPRWELLFRHAAGVATFPPALVGSAVAFIDTTGRLCCYDRHTGVLDWSVPWPHQPAYQLPLAVSPRGRFAVGNSFGRVGVFGRDGTSLLAFTAGKRITTTMTWLHEQALLVGVRGALEALCLP